jgi:transposase-like protein
MSFRRINPKMILKGTVLAMAELLFSDRVPTLKEYATESGVAPSTFRRAAKWALGPLEMLLEQRRPGPEPSEADDSVRRSEALEKLRDLRTWLRTERPETATNNCYPGEAKQRIAALAEQIEGSGILSFKEIAAVLGMDERQLYRIRKQVEKAAGSPPEPESRRPKTTQDLAPEIQRLIRDIEASGDSRDPYTAADVKRILEKNYNAQLLKHHGTATISETTVRRYMTPAEQQSEKQEREHRRGNYHYPEPFQQVAIDTAQFKLFGRIFYLITVLEFCGRLNLVTRIFLKENTEAVVSVLEERVERFPQVEATVIDRGSPYLNEEVKRILEDHGRLRIVCPVATPTAKAACERHFRTLKDVLRPAVDKVFGGKDPGWESEQLAKALELGTAVFQELYHKVPQEGIDGLSPLERIEDFDPVRACASSLELFRRSLESEPADDYARHLHRRFQLPGSEKEAVTRLKQFGTRALRRAEQDVAPFMGPPSPAWMHDPLGFLAARARKAYENERETFQLERYFEAERERFRQNAQDQERKLDEERENPERFLDSWIDRLVDVVKSGFVGGQNLAKKFLREALVALSRQLRSAFSSEVRRLKDKVALLSEEDKVRERAERILDELTEDLLEINRS